MASSGALLFVSMCIGAVHGRSGFITVHCKSENVGEYGRRTLLECVVQNADWIKDPEIRAVSWRKEGVEAPILSFHMGHMNAQKGYMLAEPSWNKTNMNVSLLITNTVVEDAGEYLCTVVTKVGDHKCGVDLKVSAKYSQPMIRSLPEKITQETGGCLICESHDGHPKGEIRWFDDKHTEWTKSSRMEANQTQSGLFTLVSNLTLLPGSMFSEYTCVVSCGGEEARAVFRVGGTSAATGTGKVSASDTSVVAGVVVIGSLIVGLLLALLALLVLRLRRRRRLREARKESTTAFIISRQQDMYDAENMETSRSLKREDGEDHFDHGSDN